MILWNYILLISDKKLMEKLLLRILSITSKSNDNNVLVNSEPAPFKKNHYLCDMNDLD